MGDTYDFNGNDFDKKNQNQGSESQNGSSNFGEGYSNNQNQSNNNSYGYNYQDSNGGYSYNQNQYNYGQNAGYNGNNGQNKQFNQGNPYYTYQVLNQGTRGFSIASLVIGIISVVCCCTGYIGIIGGVLAIVFSIISRKKIGYFDGMAIAGLVLGIFGTVLGGLLVLLTLSPEYQEMYNYYYDYYYNFGQSGNPNEL